VTAPQTSAKVFFVDVGDMVILTARTILSAIRPPYPYGEEFIDQFLRALRVCWFPLLVSMIAVGLGAPGLQAGGFLKLLGTLDRLGGFFILTAIREFAPFVTAVVVLGAAGSAITADLGSRKIREELDALQVLGVDPIKNLVVPRFLALIAITGLLDIFAMVAGLSSGIVTELINHESLGGFFATLLTNASILDLAGSVIKCMLFGAIIAVVCCYKGMTVSGGAAGVGRGVNDAVVISLLGVGAFNYIFTQTMLATNPQLQTLR
jgi:phospholipid/cholesterol/gamma-HCH transport system permease protein